MPAPARSATALAAARHPYRTAARTTARSRTRKGGRKGGSRKTALRRGTRKHAAIAKLVGLARCPPKAPKYVRHCFDALQARKLRLVAAEVAYCTRSHNGIIDLVAVALPGAPAGSRTTVIEVKTINAKRAAWEAELARNPAGRRAVDARRAQAQVACYKHHGPYANPDAMLLYVFQDGVLLCRSTGSTP